MTKEQTEQLKKIKEEVVNLKDSPLYEERISNNNYPVIGEGNHEAKLMFVGEAPGRNEAKSGRPFCGAAGRILDELLEHISVKREDVYITNIVKDRPPSNRDPLPSEITIYGPFLDRQIEIIKPEIIAPLGRFASQYILEKFDLPIKTIGELHGQSFDAVASYGEIKICPCYHPAVAVYNSNQKDLLKKDFQTLKKYL